MWTQDGHGDYFGTEVHPVCFDLLFPTQAPQRARRNKPNSSALSFHRNYYASVLDERGKP